MQKIRNMMPAVHLHHFWFCCTEYTIHWPGWVWSVDYKLALWWGWRENACEQNNIYTWDHGDENDLQSFGVMSTQCQNPEE